MEFDNSIIMRFLNLGSGNIGDANGRLFSMDCGIKPLDTKMKIFGKACPIKCYPGDNLTIHKAIYTAQPKDVLVVDADGYSAGHFGEIMSIAAMQRGIAGLVIDGGCRDAAEIKALGFPVFARSLNPRGTVKSNIGSIGTPVTCGSMTIYPTDYIFGDCDGVIVIPESKLMEVLERAEGIAAKENEIKKQLGKGATTLEIYQLNRLLAN